MTKKVSVMIKATGDTENGTVKEEVQIATKHDIFKLPIEAMILSP